MEMEILFCLFESMHCELQMPLVGHKGIVRLGDKGIIGPHKGIIGPQHPHIKGPWAQGPYKRLLGEGPWVLGLPSPPWAQGLGRSGRAWDRARLGKDQSLTPAHTRAREGPAEHARTRPGRDRQRWDWDTR